MLNAIAEDLKEYAKVKESPNKIKRKDKKQVQEEEEDAEPEASPFAAEEELVSIDDKDVEDYEDRPQYLQLELASTVYFQEVDIDMMLKYSSIDDMMKALQVGRAVKTEDQQDDDDLRKIGVSNE